jgi:hypothetical protein
VFENLEVKTPARRLISVRQTATIGGPLPTLFADGD